MTEPFDPVAIARRVVARQRAANNAPPARREPLHHVDGIRTGTGSDAHGLDLPVHNPNPRDLFDRLAEAQERRRIQSPFTFTAELAAPADATIAYTADAGWHIAVVDAEALLEQLAEHHVEADMTCRTVGCGEPLTGAGAGRGWVLVRIVSSGDPARRYCSGRCATEGITKAERRSPTAPVVSMPSRGNGARASADRIKAMGVTPSQVRKWAFSTGVMTTTKGAIPGYVIDAYVAAHRTASA